MKAVQLKQIGGIESLEYSEVADPSPQAGEVCVRLRAAAINRRDISLRKRPASASMLPFVPGSDGSGVIESLGPGVNRWSISQPVVINPALYWGVSPRCPGEGFRILGGPDNGTYAERIIVPAENIFPKPKRLSFQQAAACPVGLLTAWRALVTLGAVKPGERVLIPGVGSGVATFAVQIGKLCGCIVFVTSSSDEKITRALALGADMGVNYTMPDWGAQIKDLTGGMGFDVILDSVGSPTFGIGLELLAPGGRMITFGATVDAQVECNVRHIYSKHIQILGTTLGSPWEFAEALRAVEAGGIEPVIDQVFLLPEAGVAQKRLEDGLQFGKIVLEIS